MSVDSARRSHNLGFLAEDACGQSLYGIHDAVLLVAIVLEYTIRVRSVFRQVACAIGSVTHGACFA